MTPDEASAPPTLNAAGTSPDIHALSQAVLTLAMELWVSIDRQRALEHALEARGIAVSDTIARWQPAGDEALRLSAERDGFVGRVLAALAPARPAG